MMKGQGPLAVHRALFSLLAGHVFPRPPWSLLWRQRLMELLTVVQRHVPLAPRRERRRLIDAEPLEPKSRPTGGDGGIRARGDEKEVAS